MNKDFSNEEKKRNKQITVIGILLTLLSATIYLLNMSANFVPSTLVYSLFVLVPLAVYFNLNGIKRSNTKSFIHLLTIISFILSIIETLPLIGLIYTFVACSGFSAC